MTKREICERLVNIHNRIFHEYAMADGIEDLDLEAIGKDIGALILELAAPEEEKREADAPETEMGDKSAPRKPCPKCGAPSPKRIDAPGYYCEPCGAGFEAEEKHPGVIAKPGKDGEIEWCWCQKCYEQAAVVHDPFGDGENWSYCKKCGVSFRLKRREGEK